MSFQTDIVAPHSCSSDDSIATQSPVTPGKKTADASPQPASEPLLRRRSAVEAGRAVFREEAAALLQLADTLGTAFDAVVQAITESTGRLVVMGVGKSGIVGRKIAATLASTGTPAFFVHATEAFHGDLGMIQRGDIVLLISQSGSTSETVSLIEPLKRIGAKLIAMTGNAGSRLARDSDYLLLTPVVREACPNNLAPTTSTTCAMAMGDALAVALMRTQNFTAECFAGFHPGGALGRRMARVCGHMRTEDLPICTPGTPLLNALARMTQSRLGLIVVMQGGRLIGIVTDGDVRRCIERLNAEEIPGRMTIDRMVNTSPVLVSPDATLAEAEELMRGHAVKSLLVSDDGRTLDGILDLYDIR